MLNNQSQKAGDNSQQLQVNNMVVFNVVQGNNKDTLLNQKSDDNILDLHGPAIYFKINDPIMILSDSVRGEIKTERYFFTNTNNYIYIKITPSKINNMDKKDIQDRMLEGNRISVYPFMSSPEYSPEVNRDGVIVVKASSNKTVTDLTQIFTNLSLVGISTSFLNNGNYKDYIYLGRLNKGIIKEITDYISAFKSDLDDCMADIEIGLCISGDYKLIIPYLVDTSRTLLSHENGPLRKGEEYKINRTIDLKSQDQITGISKEFIEHIMKKIGVKFDYDEYKWN